MDQNKTIRLNVRVSRFSLLRRHSLATGDNAQKYTTNTMLNYFVTLGGIPLQKIIIGHVVSSALYSLYRTVRALQSLAPLYSLRSFYRKAPS